MPSTRVRHREPLHVGPRDGVVYSYTGTGNKAMPKFLDTSSYTDTGYKPKSMAKSVDTSTSSATATVLSTKNDSASPSKVNDDMPPSMRYTLAHLEKRKSAALEQYRKQKAEAQKSKSQAQSDSDKQHS